MLHNIIMKGIKLKDILPLKIVVLIVKNGQVLGKGEVELNDPYKVIVSLTEAYKKAIEKIQK